MFRDSGVLSFKSDYSAHTSTSDPRLSEWMVCSRSGCCNARRASTLPQNLADYTEKTCCGDEQMEKILPGTPPPPPPFAKAYNPFSS